MTDLKESAQIPNRPWEVDLIFTYPSRWYKTLEQYRIYDWNDMIADVGGFMGLLLGSSLLSIYQAAEGQLRSMFLRTEVARSE